MTRLTPVKWHHLFQIFQLNTPFIYQKLTFLAHLDYHCSPPLHIHTWLMSVDDNFMRQQSLDKLNNSLLKSNVINFPFLYVKLPRTKKSINKSVYRKRMSNQYFILNNSYYSFTYKTSDYRFFIRRAFVVCTQNILDDNQAIFVELFLIMVLR